MNVCSISAVYGLYTNNQLKYNHTHENDYSGEKISKTTFCGSGYLKAKEYLNSAKVRLYNFDKYDTDIYARFNLSKLDGIQEGIKVFNGLNLKEITFIARGLMEIAVNRGCFNRCSHCYADAMPPIQENNENINKMSWEDFKSLTDGFKELNTRLGFYITAPNIIPKENLLKRYLTPFHDADCMDLMLYDNQGNEHDFIEIYESLYNAFGMPVLFDTAGWNLNSVVHQKRAEKYVKHFADNKDSKKIYDINISINPFHAINTKSIMESRNGNLELAEKMRDIYTSRMANVIFTFTPVLRQGMLAIISRAIPDSSDFLSAKGFQQKDLNVLTQEIAKKLEKLYEQDFLTNQKYIKDERRIKSYVSRFEKMMEKAPMDAGFILSGRGVKTFGTDNIHYSINDSKIRTYNKKIAQYKTPTEFINDLFAGIIDSNGDYYLTTFWSTYKTELKLNFNNKDKKTAQLNPGLQKDLVIKKDVINNC